MIPEFVVWAKNRIRREVLCILDRAINDALSPKAAWTKAVWLESLPYLASYSDWPSLAVQSYGRVPEFTSDTHNAELFDWEKRAIATYFPLTPARVLVGGAGGGREMLGLQKMGYQTAGFDPSPDFIEYAKTKLDTDSCLAICEGDYIALIDGMPEIETHMPFDAAILGWGSFAHIGKRDTEKKLLKTLRHLCPKGPLLLSWLSRPEAGPHRSKIREFMRLHRLKMNENIVFDSHLGFISLLDLAKIEALAEPCGWRVMDAHESLLANWALLR